MGRQWIKAIRKPIVQKYIYFSHNHKAKCLECSKVMNYITYTKNDKRKHLGFYCSHCDMVYIDIKHSKILSFEWKNI